MEDTKAVEIIKMCIDAGMKIDIGARYSVKGQIAQLLNVCELLMDKKPKLQYFYNKELEKIRTWDISTPENLCDLIDFIKCRWQYSNSGYFEINGINVCRLRLSTAGCSSNEAIISALQSNPFWLFWEKSVKGGHHYFKINFKKFYGNRRKK